MTDSILNLKDWIGNPTNNLAIQADVNGEEGNEPKYRLYHPTGKPSPVIFGFDEVSDLL